jgi:hypothetical protein
MIHAACDSAYAVADVIVIHDGERYGNFERQSSGKRRWDKHEKN